MPLLPERGAVIDVGTGGGLPGIVWAVCRPGLRVTLLDSITRKCALVDKIAAAMGLANVSVVCSRSEDYAKKQAEKFDAAAARAVCSAGVLAEYLTPFVKRGGRLLAFKGPKAAEEPRARGRKMEVARPLRAAARELPLEDMERCVAVWDKVAPTPKGIPRPPGHGGEVPVVSGEREEEIKNSRVHAPSAAPQIYKNFAARAKLQRVMRGA